MKKIFASYYFAYTYVLFTVMVDNVHETTMV